MCSLNHINALRVMFNTHPNTVNVQRHRPNTIQYPPKHSPGTIYALIEVNRNKLHQQTLPDTRPLKSVGVPPTAKLWPDWSPQKRVNRDKLDQRQKMIKSRFNHQFCSKTCFNHQYCTKINYFFIIQCLIKGFVAMIYIGKQLEGSRSALQYCAYI